PVIFLAISSGINIVLDLVFVLVFDMGVEGPAIATVLAQGVSGIICLWYMYRKFPVLHASREEWRPEFSYMGKLCYIGIPMGLQYSVTAIGTLVLQAAVNGLGAAVVAGVTAGQKINAFIQCPLEALGQTMAPYAGQNMGAEKYDRIGKGLKSAVGMGFAVSVLCFVLAIFFGKQLTMLFVDASETTIISYSYQFLLYCTGGYCLLTLVNTVRFTIQGMGFSVFAILSGIMEMIARILAATVVVQMIGFAGTCLAHPMAWLFADVFLIPAFFWCRKKVAKQG
ncbi:MAG: MATE family efflux transporter, partial [Candidatus Choladocola sp.]|nr:MATE family efflux transporter [Candidatus Choladocola sp.]